MKQEAGTSEKFSHRTSPNASNRNSIIRPRKAQTAFSCPFFQRGSPLSRSPCSWTFSTLQELYYNCSSWFRWHPPSQLKQFKTKEDRPCVQIKKVESIILFPAVAGLIVSCTKSARIYAGTELPKEEIATVEFYSPLQLMTVDGGKAPINPGVVELLPLEPIFFRREKQETTKEKSQKETGSVSEPLSRVSPCGNAAYIPFMSICDLPEIVSMVPHLCALLSRVPMQRRPDFPAGHGFRFRIPR